MKDKRQRLSMASWPYGMASAAAAVSTDPGLFAYLMNAAAAASLAHYSSYAACLTPPHAPPTAPPFGLYAGFSSRPAGLLSATPTTASPPSGRLLGAAAKAPPPFTSRADGTAGDLPPQRRSPMASPWEPLDCHFLYGSVIPTLGLSTPPRIHPALLSA